MAKKISTYVDTGAFIAFLDTSDTYHPLFRLLFNDPPLLWTTPLVLAEAHGWFLRRYDNHRALEFLNFVEVLQKEKILKIADCDEKVLREAAKILRKFSDQKLTLTDATGLWFLKQKRLKSCWSTDHYLSLSGISLVIHEKT